MNSYNIDRDVPKYENTYMYVIGIYTSTLRPTEFSVVCEAVRQQIFMKVLYETI
jgi:hypothetical protein